MRIVLAMAEVVCERGLEDTTVAGVVARARVSRRTFYDLFDDRGEALLATFDEGVRRAQARVVRAVEVERGWVEQTRAALRALLVFCDEEPQLARLCVVHSLGGGPAVLERRAEVLKRITAELDGRARQAQKGPVPPVLTAEGVVGGVLAIVHARLLEQRPVPLVGLLGPLMGMLVLPYAGRAAAERELSRSAPPEAVEPEHPLRRRGAKLPLEDLEMRLTYRTLRVLTAIATVPGASNRDIADHAGVKDQGQISKLLTRLERLGLAHNTGAGAPKGEPNVWTLTNKGHEIENATRVGNSTT